MVSVYNNTFHWRKNRRFLIGISSILIALSLFIYIGSWSTDIFSGRFRKMLNRTAMESRMYGRKQHLVETCKLFGERTPTYTMTAPRLMYFEPKKMAMCYVPKAGCTFWKQVFFYLKGTANNDPNPKEIFQNKLFVHYKLFPRILDVVSFDHRYEILTQSEKIIFVRNPYTRLLSGYIDKILLPEFWTTFGVAIVRETRTNPDPLSLKCGYDVTFEEFLRRVIIKAKENVMYYGDEHWYPISKSCLPCTFGYNIVGKLETFESDRDWILEKFGIADVLPQDQAWEDKLTDAVAQSFRVCFKFYRNPICKKNNLVADRLWKSLILQGFIADDVPFSALFPNTEDIDLDKLLFTFRKMAPSNHEFRERRQKAFMKAYRDIPDDLLAEVRQAFSDDFLLFDYDPLPTEIYSYR